MKNVPSNFRIMEANKCVVLCITLSFILGREPLVQTFINIAVLCFDWNTCIQMYAVHIYIHPQVHRYAFLSFALSSTQECTNRLRHTHTHIYTHSQPPYS